MYMQFNKKQCTTYCKEKNVSDPTMDVSIGNYSLLYCYQFL